jgi:lysozyme family protein
VDDPLDNGGETHFGMTIPFAGQWQIPWPPTLADARDGYRRMLAGTRIDQIPDDATLDLVADSAVNHGQYKAIYWLQEALGVTVDGIIGPITIRSMTPARFMSRHLFNNILKSRGLYYAAIIHNDPTQSRFANGWFSRLFAFLT